MTDAPINRPEFYRRPEDRDRFFERVMRDAGRPPFVRPPAPVGLCSRPRAHQIRPDNFLPAVVRLPEVTRSDQ